MKKARIISSLLLVIFLQALLLASVHHHTVIVPEQESDFQCVVDVDHSFRQDHFLEGTETATPAYTLLGASVHTDILSKGKRVASLSLVGENLTDRVYVDHLNRLKYVGLRNPGRNITIKLEIPLVL